MWEEFINTATRVILEGLNWSYVYVLNNWQFVLSISLTLILAIVGSREYKRLKRIANVGISHNEARHKGQQCDVIRDKNGDPTALSYTHKSSVTLKLSGTADVKFISGKKEE